MTLRVCLHALMIRWVLGVCVRADADDNGIGDQGAAYLAAALKLNDALTYLDLGECTRRTHPTTRTHAGNVQFVAVVRAVCV